MCRLCKHVVVNTKQFGQSHALSFCDRNEIPNTGEKTGGTEEPVKRTPRRTW